MHVANAVALVGLNPVWTLMTTLFRFMGRVILANFAVDNTKNRSELATAAM